MVDLEKLEDSSTDASKASQYRAKLIGKIQDDIESVRATEE